MRKTKNKFTPDKCEHCGQTETYLLGLDKGSAAILLEIFDGIARKGINQIHPAQELDLSGKKKWFLTNLSRPRFHGLIAYVDREKKPGYYCLTRKAGKFLRGADIPKYAIISKVTGHQAGYWQEETDRVSLRDLITSPTMWAGRELDMINRLDPTEEVYNGRLFDRMSA